MHRISAYERRQRKKDEQKRAEMPCPFCGYPKRIRSKDGGLVTCPKCGESEWIRILGQSATRSNKRGKGSYPIIFYKGDRWQMPNGVVFVVGDKIKDEFGTAIELINEETGEKYTNDIMHTEKFLKREKATLLPKKLPQSNRRSNMITLYHGTCEGSAKRLLKNGFKPEYATGGNMGRPGLLYLTNVPENAMWFAEQMGCSTILVIDVPVQNLIVDPDDGVGVTVDEELAMSKRHGTPAYLATSKKISSKNIRILKEAGKSNKRSKYGEKRMKILQNRTEASIKQQPGLAKLRDKLLAIGGDVIVPVFEEDLDKLLKRGRVFKGPVTMMKGEPIRCHQNTAELYRNNLNNPHQDLRIVTGWGMTIDNDGLGVWRQHSFIWDMKNKRVIETTEKRDIYFGVMLRKQEAEVFVDDNLWPL